MQEAHDGARKQMDRDRRELYEGFVFDKAQNLNGRRYVNYGRIDASTPPLVLIPAADLIRDQAEKLAEMDAPDGDEAEDAAFESRWNDLVEKWLTDHRGLSEPERQRLRQQLLA